MYIYGKNLIFQVPTFCPCQGEKKKRIRYSRHLFTCPLISIIEDQMEEAKDLGMSSVCAVNDEHRGHIIWETLFDIWIGQKCS
jgi:superfamily II DNA helicase RecQ